MHRIRAEGEGIERSTELSDGDCLARYATAGEESLFDAVVTRHQGLAMRVCHHILRNRTDAEDAARATFLLLPRQARKLTAPVSLAAWLHRAAVYVARNHRRAQSRRTHRERVVARTEIRRRLRRWAAAAFLFIGLTALFGVPQTRFEGEQAAGTVGNALRVRALAQTVRDTWQAGDGRSSTAARLPARDVS